MVHTFSPSPSGLEPPMSPGACEGVLRKTPSGHTDAAQSVVIRPLLVATIQRLPQRTMESIRPAPGTVSPTDTLRTPSGPCNTAMPPDTFRTVQPSIVVGLVSGVGVGLFRLHCPPSARHSRLRRVDGRRNLVPLAPPHDPASILIGQRGQVLHCLHVSPAHQRLLRERNPNLLSRARFGLEHTATIVCPARFPSRAR